MSTRCASSKRSGRASVRGSRPWRPRATTESWHAPTVSWTARTDTIGNRSPWSSPGGGLLDVLGEGVVSRATGDSLVIEIDSARVAAWSDTTDASRGIVVRALDSGRRLDYRSSRLRVDTRPSINQDTLVVFSMIPQQISFLYDPLPDPPPDGIRVGGAPAWRSYLTLKPADEITSGPICELVQCPLKLTSDRVNQAELVLTSRASELAYQPTDTTRLDVRALVLVRAVHDHVVDVRGRIDQRSDGLDLGVEVADQIERDDRDPSAAAIHHHAARP